MFYPSSPMTRMRPLTGCKAAVVGARVDVPSAAADGFSTVLESTAGMWAKQHQGGPF